MSDLPDSDRWFRELEPPPGGLAALRARLERRQRRRTVTWWSTAAVTATAVLALAALLWLVPVGGTSPLLVGDDLLAIRLGLIEAPSEPVTVTPGGRSTTALKRVPTRDDRVVLYLAGSI